MSIMVKVEEKLYQNRYIVDESRPHIQIKSAEACQSCEKQACTFCCPAAYYSKNETGGVTLVTDQPVEGVESIDTAEGLELCWG